VQQCKAKEDKMKFLIVIMAVRTVITMISKKGRVDKTKPVEGAAIQHPAEMQLR
jgi:hypothetical protein